MMDVICFFLRTKTISQPFMRLTNYYNAYGLWQLSIAMNYRLDDQGL